MKITNTDSLAISNRIQETTQMIAQSLQRLSTGQRILSPADDPAGSAVSVNLSAQIQGLVQAQLNISHASGLIQTADSEISTQMDIVQKMREIAVQAGSDLITSTDRDNLNQQLSQVYAEFQNITNTTQFDGQNLLDGSFDPTSVQVGAQYGQSLSLNMPSLNASSQFTKMIGTGKFQTRTTIDSGSEPYTVQSADLNGDNIQDLIELDRTDGTVSVRLGTGDGNFSSRTTYTVGTTPEHLSVGDFNNDGAIDIVAADTGGSTLSVLMNNGDGTFADRVTYQAGNAPKFVAVGDMNGDGYVDIVDTDFTDNTASVFLNNGDGTFADRITSGTGAKPTGVQLADFNGDNKLDMALAINGNGTGTTIKVGYGNGDGTFSGTTSYTVGTGPAQIKSGDFNQDGFIDLAVSNVVSSNVSILLGQSDGSFGSANNYSVGGFPRTFDVGDINGVGRLDIVSADKNDDTASILLGNGDGSFQSRSTLSVGQGPTYLALADLTGDGVLDIATADSTDNTISILKGNSKTASAVPDLKVSTVDQANALIDILDNTLNGLSGERAKLSSTLDRLTINSDKNDMMSAAYQSAKDGIDNVDVALETSKVVTNQILEQAQISALSQSNLQVQMVVRLLSNL